MSCESCGSQLLWGAKFCGNCGSLVQQSQSVSYLPPPPAPQSPVFGWFHSDKNRVRALLLLTVILGGALLFSSLENASLQSRLTTLQNEASSYQTQLQSSEVQNSQLQYQVSQLQSQNTYLSNQVQSLNLQGAHPTLTLWTLPQSVAAGHYLYGGVPDTFTYHVSFTSTVPITVYILDGAQFAQFYTSGLSGISTSYYSFSATTSLSDGIFHLAEGCAAYVAVYHFNGQSGTIYPDVTVQYNPASTLTGACA
jgi:hypothetical protein